MSKKMIAVRLNDEELNRLNERAKQENRSRENLLRVIINEYLKRG